MPFFRDALDLRRGVTADDDGTVHALARYGRELLDAGRPNEAQPALADALTRCRQRYGSDDPRTLAVLTDAARALAEGGRTAEALVLSQEAVDRCGRVLGDDLRTAAALDVHARVLNRLGRPDDGRTADGRALAIKRKAYGEDYIKALDEKIDECIQLNNEGRSDEAITLAEQTLAAYRRVLGDRNTKTVYAEMVFADRLRDKAVSTHSPSLLGESETHYKKALEGARGLSGPDDDLTIEILQNYSQMLAVAGRPSDCVPVIKTVLETQRRKLGNTHPSTLATASGLARFLGDMDRIDEAEKVCLTALEWLREENKETDPAAGRVIDAYSRILCKADRAAEAEPMQRALLQRERRRLGDDHPDVAMYGVVYAKVLDGVGRREDANAVSATFAQPRNGKPPLPGYADNDFIGVAPVPRNSPVGMRVNTLLGDAAGLVGQQSFAEARDAYLQALKEYRTTIKADDSSVAVILVRVGAIDLELGQAADAEQRARQAQAILKGQEWPSPLNVANAGSNLGRALVARGQYAEAEAPLRTAVSIRERLLGRDRTDIRRTANALADVLDHTDRAAEADALRKAYERPPAAKGRPATPGR